jgi:hypothetical protein
MINDPHQSVFHACPVGRLTSGSESAVPTPKVQWTAPCAIALALVSRVVR